jgi:hypothetical protein
MAEQEHYEAPSVAELGTLHELTLKVNKYYKPTSDFNYPNGLLFST